MTARIRWEPTFASGWHRKHDVHGGPHDEQP